MEFSKGSSTQILERLSTAYGVDTQKQLAEKLGVSAANVSNWVQRNSVPGSAFVRCVLDTGCDLSWLATGEFANANLSRFAISQGKKKGKELINWMLSTGGKSVLQRIISAYGFHTQKELSEYLGISTATISTWVRREYFPGDVVITCALDTNAPLEWLATGNESRVVNIENYKAKYIQHKKLSAGLLEDIGYWFGDISFVKHDFKTPIFVEGVYRSWVVESEVEGVSNGCWILSIDGKHDVYDATVLPKNRISIQNNGRDFICDINDIVVIGKVLLTMEYKL